MKVWLVGPAGTVTVDGTLAREGGMRDAPARLLRRGSEDDERRLRKAALLPRGDELADEGAGGAVVLQHRVARLACDEEVAVRAERHALGLIEAAEAGGDEDAFEGAGGAVVALDPARRGAAEEQVAVGAKDQASRIQDVALLFGDELVDERVVPWVVAKDLAGSSFRSAGDIEQAIPSEGHRFGVVEPGRVGRIDNGLEGAGGAVEAEDLVAAAVVGEA